MTFLHDYWGAFVLPGVFLFFCAVILVPYWFFARSRSRQMQALAQRLGASFHRAHDPRPRELLPQFEGSQMRLPLSGFNTIHATVVIANHPCDVILGDCANASESDPSALLFTEPTSSYAAFRLPFAAPDILIRQDVPAITSLFGSSHGKAADLLFLGLEPVEFESEAFNQVFDVFAADRRFAYDLMDQAMMEFFLSTLPPPLFIQGGWCVVGAVQNDRWDARNFERVLEWSKGFAARWPRILAANLEPRS